MLREMGLEKFNFIFINRKRKKRNEHGKTLDIMV
jgi:hypothetical protein